RHVNRKTFPEPFIAVAALKYSLSIVFQKLIFIRNDINIVQVIDADEAGGRIDSGQKPMLSCSLIRGYTEETIKQKAAHDQHIRMLKLIKIFRACLKIKYIVMAESFLYPDVSALGFSPARLPSALAGQAKPTEN